MDVKPLRVRQAEETRQLLVTTARGLFTEHGYAGTSIEDIIRRAGVARGALYHHFDGKQAVFKAVYDEVQADAVTSVMQAAMRESEPWAAVRAGLSAFLDAALDPAFRRVIVLDSVSVLQHQMWDGGAEPAELPMLRNVLGPLVASDRFPAASVESLVYMTLGGLYGAALYIARASEPATARADAEVVLDAVLTGLRAQLDGEPRRRRR